MSGVSKALRATVGGCLPLSFRQQRGCPRWRTFALPFLVSMVIAQTAPAIVTAGVMLHVVPAASNHPNLVELTWLETLAATGFVGGGVRADGALLVGYFQQGQLRYAGCVRTEDRRLLEVVRAVPQRSVAGCPFVDLPHPIAGKSKHPWDQRLRAADRDRCVGYSRVSSSK